MQYDHKRNIDRLMGAQERLFKLADSLPPLSEDLFRLLAESRGLIGAVASNLNMQKEDAEESDPQTENLCNTIDALTERLQTETSAIGDLVRALDRLTDRIEKR